MKFLLTMLMEQQTVTNPAVIHGLCVHDKTLNQQWMLAQAHPSIINHLTSNVNRGARNNLHVLHTSCAGPPIK